jgi:CheY-like chemotaxis protein
VLQRADGRLRIEVTDNGIGFDAAAPPADGPNAPASSKFGLFSIRERMKALGGTFEIRSCPGKGTTAQLSLPLPDSGSHPGVRNSAMESAGRQQASRRQASESSSPDAGDVVTHPRRTRVLLVDDHAMVREGLRSVLEAYDDVEVVGEAANGEDAVALVERLRPALVVMDINMPRVNGIEATAHITRMYPEIHVIGLSVNADGNNVQAMLKAGAVLLLTKEAAVNELYRRMREILVMHAGSATVSH